MWPAHDSGEQPGKCFSSHYALASRGHGVSALVSQEKEFSPFLLLFRYHTLLLTLLVVIKKKIGVSILLTSLEN